MFISKKTIKELNKKISNLEQIQSETTRNLSLANSKIGKLKSEIFYLMFPNGKLYTKPGFSKYFLMYDFINSNNWITTINISNYSKIGNIESIKSIQFFKNSINIFLKFEMIDNKKTNIVIDISNERCIEVSEDFFNEAKNWESLNIEYN